MQSAAAPPEPLALAPMHRLWRGLPPVLRRRALARVTAMLAPSSASAPAAPGLVIAGELSRPSGLGEGARLMATAAQCLGLPVWTVDVPPMGAGPVPDPLTAVPPGVPLVLHVNAPLLPLAL